MSHISENIAWQAGDLRTRYGATVTFDGAEYRCITEEVSAAKVGVEMLPREALGPYIASYDPRVFRLNPADFYPTTDVRHPQEGDELLWHRLKYRVTKATYDDGGEDTHALSIYAFRNIV